jgi:hypothetical protein
LQAQVIDVEHPLAGSRVDEQGRPVDSGERFFRLTQAAVDWRQHRGWLVDLDIEPGQKVLQAPQTLSTQLHVGAVLPPGPAPDCGAMSATGFNIVLDGLTGAAASAPVFDTNHDGIVDGSDGQAAIREAASNGLATLISAQSDVVDAAAPPRQCLPDVNARCRRPDACVVLVVNASDEAELICIDRLGPSERPGSCTGEGPCPKVIVDRAWRSLLNPPQP